MRLLPVHWSNSLLYGLPTIYINKLQKVQNAPDRPSVTNTPGVSVILLPFFEYRIEFTLLLTFKCLYGLAPQYLVDLIAVAAQSRNNRTARNATLTHGAYLHLVTKPFSLQLPNCRRVF